MMRTHLTLAAAFVAIVAALLGASMALAHAEITEVSWDNPANPTRVIGNAEEDIRSVTRTYYLKVFNSANQEVDTGNFAVADANRKQMTVSVQANLPAGTYRVDWATVSDDDGDADSGSLALELAAQATPTQPATVAPTQAVATQTSVRIPATGGVPPSEGLSWLALGLLSGGALSMVAGAALVLRRKQH
jgi:methionine-rich copper-binding protein CopC